MSTEELIALLNAARAAEIADNVAEAERLTNSVLTSIDADNDSHSVLRHRALSQMGNIERLRGHFTEAMDLYTTVLAYCESVADKAGVAHELGNMGIVQWYRGDYSGAIEYYIRALEIHEEQSNKDGVAKSNGNIALACERLSDYVRALDHAKKSLDLYDELDKKSGVASMSNLIGDLYRNLSDFARALEYFAKALELYTMLNDREGMLRATSNLGAVHAHVEEYSLALEYFAKAMTLSEELGHKIGLAAVYGNMGVVFMELSDFANSSEYLGKSLAIYQELGDEAGVANVLGNIGSMYSSQKDYAPAMEYFHRALQLQDDLGLRAQSASLRAFIGAAYASVDYGGRDEVKAESFLMEAIATNEQIGTKQYYPHLALAELYEKQKRWEEFALEFKKYHAIKDEVQKDEAKKSIAQMEQRKLIAEREKVLDVERAEARATQSILHKVLPASIADRLVKGEKVADYFQAVSILFADIVGFTPLASRMPANEVLTFLNYVFGEFDRLAALHGCEKIKTIGDGYLAVAGAPIVCEDHAERITRLALDIMNGIVLPEHIRSTLPQGAQFKLRIGIHTGPCFGGIVGENRFVYDIYSDAVNLAARMESHGEPGRIHISDEFCLHLQKRIESTGEDFGGARFVEREEMEIKGKGKMRTYFLERV